MNDRTSEILAKVARLFYILAGICLLSAIILSVSTGPVAAQNPPSPDKTHTPPAKGNCNDDFDYIFKDENKPYEYIGDKW